MRPVYCAIVVLAVVLALAGCGVKRAHRPARSKPPATTTATTASLVPLSAAHQPHPQVVEPVAGQQAQVQAQDPSEDPTQALSSDPAAAATPVGDPNAHAPPLSQVESELKTEMVSAQASSSGYINPLKYVTVWERTDQGVDANLPVGAPILAPGTIKILAIEPDWYAGQPLVYWELLSGPDAGKVQYVAEEITNIAPPGSILQQGQVIAQYAPTGTGIEFGWSTPSGVTLAVATTGYEEGEATPAGQSMRAWLNSLGANAGSG